LGGKKKHLTATGSVDVIKPQRNGKCAPTAERSFKEKTQEHHRRRCTETVQHQPGEEAGKGKGGRAILLRDGGGKGGGNLTTRERCRGHGGHEVKRNCGKRRGGDSFTEGGGGEDGLADDFRRGGGKRNCIAQSNLFHQGKREGWRF